MSFFGMGAWELGIILVAALVIFGPGKLPEVAGQAGRAVRDFRRMTADLSGEFEKTIADVTDAKGTLGKELKGITGQVNSVTSSVKKDLNKSTGSTSAKSTASKSTTAKPSTAKATGSASAAKATTTTAAAKSSTSSGKAAATTKAAEAPAAPKVASKTDPLADLFFSDDQGSAQPTVSRSATAAKPAASTPRPAATTSTEGATDAVARARQRRISAGYSNHKSS